MSCTPSSAEEAPSGPRPATRGEVIEKLNLVPVFSVSDLDNKSICATMVGNQPCGTWFADVRDAETLLATLRKHNPTMNLGIEATPLGHALALSERWVPAAAKLVTRIQASTRELESLPGFPQLPDELKKAFSPLTSRFPVWVCEDLQTPTSMPYFLHADDLKDAWFEATGKSLDEAKELDVTDLRVLVADMCCRPRNWGGMCLHPPKRTVEYMKMLKEKMIEDGDLPPPLAERPTAEEAENNEANSSSQDGAGAPEAQRKNQQQKSPAASSTVEEQSSSKTMSASTKPASSKTFSLMLVIGVAVLAIAVMSAFQRGYFGGSLSNEAGQEALDTTTLNGVDLGDELEG